MFMITNLIETHVEKRILNHHCLKSVRIRRYSGPYFLAFGMNAERYSVSLRIRSKCRKIRTRITPNTDTFYAVHLNESNCPEFHNEVSQSAFTCSKLIIETLEQGVKYVQSSQ